MVLPFSFKLTSLRFSECRKRTKQPRNAVDSTSLHVTEAESPTKRKTSLAP